MQFIKPTYVERLLKLKTSEDIAEWRDERKANFPTKSKRELCQLKNESNLNELNSRCSNGGHQSSSNKFNKFNRNNKFNNQTGKGFRNNSRLKRPFHNSRNQPQIEPKVKDPKVDAGNSDQTSSNLIEKPECSLKVQQNKFNRFKHVRQPTLLEKMLLADVKRNEDAIFKCIDLILKTNYLNNTKDITERV